MNGKRFSAEQARKNGFYLALAVCLVAVGIAAWSTYDAVQSTLSPMEQTTASAAVSNPTEDPEAPRAAARPTATPAAGSKSTAGKNTASRITEAASAALPEPPAVSAAAVPEEDPEPVTPVNAPLYELSPEMIAPVSAATVTKPYSAGAPVYSETMKDWRIHVGTDFAADSGENVLACGNGQVKETYADAMLGNVVVIEHGDFLFAYCGLGENFLVSPGDIVTMGQPIGTVTATPGESADEPHLHLEVKRDSSYLDPEDVLAQRH